MGLRGPLPKATDRRQRRNGGGGLALVLPAPGGVVPITVPEAREEWLDEMKAQWVAYWTSPLAAAVDAVTDLPALERLFALKDERERAYQGYQQQRVVAGSKGQVRVNPLAQLMLALDGEIRQLEDRFGLSTKSRLQLGIVFSDAVKSLEAMNQALDGKRRDRKGQAKPDPRLAIAR